jgi:hypothetical protein
MDAETGDTALRKLRSDCVEIDLTRVELMSMKRTVASLRLVLAVRRAARIEDRARDSLLARVA